MIFSLFSDKKSTPDNSPTQSPFLKSKSRENTASTYHSTNDTTVPDGLAPIAKTEEMSDDLSEETLVNGEPNENVSNGHVISSTPKKSSWRLSNGLLSHHSAADASAASSNATAVKTNSSELEPNWWSDDDLEEDKDQSLTNNNDHVANGESKNVSSVHSIEDGFESFSCTDEEDEGDRTSLDSTSTSR